MKDLFLTILLITAALVCRSNGLYCPSGCTCNQNQIRCIRIHLKSIPTVPLDTHLLDLRYNQIQEIPSKTFHHTFLHTIFLNENQIGLIHSDAFKGLASLKYLYLNNNRISKISSGAFQGLHNLDGLFLENNDIWEIEPETFSNLPSLVSLHLFKNKITEIPENSFRNLPQLKRLRLDSNPIECDCGVYSYLSYHRGIKSRAAISLVCSTPQELRGKSYATLVDTDFHCKKPEIIEQPRETEITQMGESIELACKAIGDPSPEIVWMQNSNEIQAFFTSSENAAKQPSPITDDESNNGSRNANSIDIINDNRPHMQILENGSLRITKATLDDNGIYECIAKNAIGEAKSRQIRMVVTDNVDEIQQLSRQQQQRSAYANSRATNVNSIGLGTATVSQTAPNFILKPPGTITVATTDAIILHCLISGQPQPQVLWSFNGKQLTQSSSSLRVHSNGTLIVPFPSENDSGLYKCQARNQFGNIQTTTRVQVKELPEIILAPQNQAIKTGATLTLECDADGNPQPKIWWKHNGVALESTTTGSDSRPTPIHNRIVLSNENTELQITSIEQNDAGQYSCVAENVNGVTEAIAEISIEQAIGAPPRILVGPYDLEALPDTTIELPCKPEEGQTPEIKWRKDGRYIANDTNVSKYEISASGSLYIKNITQIDSGRYECGQYNDYGRDIASGLITVRSNEILAPGDRFVRIAFAEAMKEIDQAINHTIEALFNPRTPDSPVNFADLLRVFRFPNTQARQLARAAEIYERTLVNIRRHIDEGANLTVPSSEYEYKELLSRDHLDLVAELSGCNTHRERPNCTDMCYHSKYRSADGTCNNLHNPTWGASLTGFRRLLQPQYENGFSSPIGWNKHQLYNGFEKPSARLVSTSLISTKTITQDDQITHMVMQWGQFLDHDLDHALPSVSSETWDGVDCKKTCEYAAPCFPIEVPPNDPRIKNRRCIDLVRSSAVCGSGMTSVFFDAVHPREQINQLTSYIDASQVYGYSTQFSQELRNLTTEDGLLRTGVHFPKQKDMLPFAAPQDGIDCRRNLEETKINCFVAGDIRVNEQVALLAMHTVWLREHNRIAGTLKELNSHWDSDTLYEEARKIVGAQMQHITYKQWLPLILGDEGMSLLGEYSGYNPNINPSISNEFATVALRFGHSLINPVLARLNETYQEIPDGHLPLHKAFFAPWRLVYEGGVDPLMRGMFSVPAKLKKPTENLNNELTEKLFHTAHAVALDLAAINIQRGREHGIPDYNEYRKFCNLSIAKTFEDLQNEIKSAEVRDKLKELYGHPSNIDPWVGGILEDQVEGGKVGPLFRCLLVEQFRRLRDGDRFYYENPSVFTPQQLLEIKQSSLARVLCDNGDNITEVGQNVFILPGQQGGYKQCTEISGINLYFWQDCGTCTSPPPLLDSYLPHTYYEQQLKQQHQHSRQRRAAKSTSSLSSTSAALKDLKIRDDEKDTEKTYEMNEERVSGLEEVISSFQKELKKLRKKIKKLEQICNPNNKDNSSSSGSSSNNNNNSNENSNNNNKKNNKNKNNLKRQRRQCLDTSGNRRLNNEIWNQDECTKCQCKHAEITCNKEKCPDINCTAGNQRPTKVAGECCQKCSNDGDKRN